MSCPKTQHLLQEYFADDLTPFASEEVEKHLRQCVHCSQELEAVLQTKSNLQQWQEQSVPHWDRGIELFRRENTEHRSKTMMGWWQWLPTAASFAMLALMLLNTTIVTDADGIKISFGNPGGSELAELDQRAELQALMVRVDERLDNNNVQLLRAVLEQTQQATADNLERIYAYFEQQRLQDLQNMQAGYQALADSDYETIRSLQQLAQFVSYSPDLQ